MNVNGLVSIVTPAYRASRYVHDAIRGAMQQTYQDWEMLVVDDCSPDDTADVIASYAERDPRVVLVRASQNGGPAGARNLALERARGRHVAFCDADDYWLPDKLQAQLEFMRTTSAPLSFTGFRRIDAGGTRTGRFIDVPSQLSYRGLLGNTAIATSSVVIDRGIVGDVRMTPTFYDDFVLWLQILRPGRIAWGLSADLLRYRVVQGSWSRNKSRSAMMVWRTYREIERLSVAESLLYLANYGVRGYLKYRSF